MRSRICGISIHALREEGDVAGNRSNPKLQQISIHALREEGDVGSVQLVTKVMNISIHALREEGDRLQAYPQRYRRNFYPRPPRGGRRYHFALRSRRPAFLSTPSARRATPFLILLTRNIIISIHALREEGDQVG